MNSDEHNIEKDVEDSNDCGNRDFDAVLRLRLQRRALLKMSGSAAAMALAPIMLTGCEKNPASLQMNTQSGAGLLQFEPVAKSIADTVTVPHGYTARVLIAVGDPLFSDAAPYRNDGTDTNFERRCGEWHDGMEYFGLSAQGTPDINGSDRGLLAINNEWVSPVFLHANGATTAPRPASEVDKEIAAMGVTVVEIATNANGQFHYVVDSPFNRRITTLTEMEITGPLRGHPKLVTRYSEDGTRTRGTVNNCGTGRTPWGTLLTGEENWARFFARDAGDDALRSEAENHSLQRYGRPADARHAYFWDTVPGAQDHHRRWNTSVTGTSSDGRDDYRHEIHGQGYVTEIDPYDPQSVIRKRTALGRMAHEGAAFSPPRENQSLAVYMGDDARGEYIYKFVSAASWDPADADAEDRLSIGAKYLDVGTLYAARFHDDGTGEWLELSLRNPAVAAYDRYPFADEGDVLLHARIAADAAGATPMDRPEWSTVNPENGDVYVTLTNNSARSESGSNMTVDAANPRAYEDRLAESTVQRGNVNGHIIRLGEERADTLAFSWDIFLFGAESEADSSLINLSGLTADQDFSSPDGIGFASSTGLCWIQTDDDALADKSNSMMLAAAPGQVGDGEFLDLNYGNTTVTTRRGARAQPSTLKRFLVGPVEQEITGVAETPDGRALFINVQHPGSETLAGNSATPESYTSHWPGNMGYGPGGELARPRSATVVIVKDDGGKVGS